MSHEPMHRVIRLKRYEQPPEEYFEDFLREFHQRQRAELLRPSLFALLWMRLLSLIPDVRVPAMTYGVSAAAALLAGAVIMWNPQPRTPSSYAVAYPSYGQPVTIQKMQPVSLRIDGPSSPTPSSLLFPPSYLLQAHPASHESPLSF